MAARGVHFALTDVEVRELESRDADEARLEHVQEEIEEQFFESRQGDLAETDKAWDAIHRCLTDGTLGGASTSPLEIVVLGGESLYSGDDYVMTLKRADEVRAVVPHLARTSGDRSNPASRGRVKSGQSLQDRVVYLGGHQACKSVCSLVRQLRGPDLRTCAWWRSRSSIALTAAVSPSTLPQSSTGRLDVSRVDTLS